MENAIDISGTAQNDKPEATPVVAVVEKADGLRSDTEMWSRLRRYANYLGAGDKFDQLTPADRAMYEETIARTDTPEAGDGAKEYAMVLTLGMILYGPSFLDREHARLEREILNERSITKPPAMQRQEYFGPPGEGRFPQCCREEYVQPVCKSGYRIDEESEEYLRSGNWELGDIVGPVLEWSVDYEVKTPPRPDGKPYKHFMFTPEDFTTYAPMKGTPMLHREFIRVVDGSRESILAFANRYGLLLELEDDDCLGCESLRHWERLLETMTMCVEGLDALRSRSRGRLIEWCEKHGYEEFWIGIPTEQLAYLVNETVTVEASSGLTMAGVSAQVIFGKGVERHESKDPAIPEVFKGCMRPGVFDALRMAYKPQNLLGAMWMMFAYEATGVKTHKQCPACEGWVEIGEMSDNRITRIYCDDTCKMRAYRARRKRSSSSSRSTP